MKKFTTFSSKTAVIALAVASLSLAGNVQAHHNDDYLPLVPFIIYNVLTRPHHHSSHQIHRNNYDNRRRHSHTRDGYRQKRVIKKHRRH